MAKISSRDVLQSYILTTAKYDFSVHEKRIVYKIIEALQFLLEGKKLDAKYKFEKDLFGDYHVTMPIADVLKSENDKNHAVAKSALLALESKRFIYEDDKVWEVIRMIEKPKIEKYALTMNFRLNEKVFSAFLDFSKGFRKYEIKTAMELESVYAMRFYELLSGKKEPVCYGIEYLKELFQITGKYERVNDFQRKVLDAAKRELDAKSPYTFDYEMIKSERRFTAVRFFPRYQREHRDPDLERQELARDVAVSWTLDKNTRDYLKTNFQFTDKEIKQHIELLGRAAKQLDLITFMSKVKPRLRDVKSPQGYLISALRKEVGE